MRLTSMEENTASANPHIGLEVVRHVVCPPLLEFFVPEVEKECDASLGQG